VAGPYPEPLTPLAFLDRAAAVFGDRLAVVDGDRRFTYAELADRSARLAGALAGLGVTPGDRVAVLSPNSHVLVEAHFGVNLAGAVLVALNTRLGPRELAAILGHCGARVVVVDRELAGLAGDAVARLGGSPTGTPPVMVVEAGFVGSPYEALLAAASPWRVAVGEDDLASISYTSGTTGEPKGAMYSHRSAYLQGVAQVVHGGLDPSSVVLWTLPMFHCNGWGYPWAVTAAGAVHLCLRQVDAAAIWRHLQDDGVTHFNAAPTVLSMIADHPDPGGRLPAEVRVATGGAPPTPALLERMADLNLRVVHLYGLTETLGPALVCEWRPEWDALDGAARARLAARQGVVTVAATKVRVVEPDGTSVPADGATAGEIQLRGPTVMRGYYRDAEATAAAFVDGWLRTGDVGVVHPDGYVEVSDRSKDVIISGGENISSVEVERALCSHPAVAEAAVVAKADDRWGETPVAFVALRPGAMATAGELADHLRSRLARFKVPKRVVFSDLPKTATGKIRKNELRDWAAGHDGPWTPAGP